MTVSAIFDTLAADTQLSSLGITGDVFLNPIP
jgi:hypothetical protein